MATQGPQSFVRFAVDDDSWSEFPDVGLWIGRVRIPFWLFLGTWAFIGLLGVAFGFIGYSVLEPNQWGGPDGSWFALWFVPYGWITLGMFIVIPLILLVQAWAKAIRKYL